MVEENQSLVESLYESSDKSSLDEAISISNEERKGAESFKDSMPLMYGEFTWSALKDLFTAVKPKEDGILYDLGSGSGKAILMCSLLHQFKRCQGIEIVKGLHEQACAALERFKTDKPALAKTVSFTLGDILEYDWSDADLVLMCATCFTEKMITKLAEKANKLAVGAIVVSVTYALPSVSKMFEVVWKGSLRMSWGDSTIFVQVKRHNRKLENVILKSFLRVK